MTQKAPRSRRCGVVLAVAGALGAGASAGAQIALYSNGGATPDDPGLATGMFTQDHTIAPPGTLWSEVPSDGLGSANSVAGFAVHDAGPGAGYRLADDFTVGGKRGWRLLTATFFVYQSDVPKADPPVTAVNLIIWNGRPGDPGSAVVYGDTSTNRLALVAKANLYRVFASATGPWAQPAGMSRLVWRCEANLDGVVLLPGRYWIDWQVTGADPSAGVFAPPVTAFGVRGKAGANAMQFRGLAGWVGLVDPGKPASGADLAQDVPFILRGGILPGRCLADFNDDGFVDGLDFDEFTKAFEAGGAASDVNGDGYADAIDLDAFSAAFEAGC